MENYYKSKIYRPRDNVITFSYQSVDNNITVGFDYNINAQTISASGLNVIYDGTSPINGVALTSGNVFSFEPRKYTPGDNLSYTISSTIGKKPVNLEEMLDSTVEDAVESWQSMLETVDIDFGDL